MRFVGVSTGRAGSLYIARVFNKAGIPTCHETVFNGHAYVDGRPKPWNRPELGEWSAQAVPFLDEIDADLVFHQVRHPLRVVGSFMGFGLFHRPETFGPEGRVITDHFDIDPSDPLRSAVRFYLDWNRRCEAHADLRWRVEDVDWVTVCRVQRLLGLPVDQDGALDACRAVPTNTNTKDNAETVSWADLADVPEVDGLKEMADRYGYW